MALKSRLLVDHRKKNKSPSDGKPGSNSDEGLRGSRSGVKMQGSV
ncbi:hypothetical protein Hdeb2414_s0009g00304171 [Helianthus debilis subsp. tardiflorus]